MSEGARMDPKDALPPLRFRFLDEDDIKEYGDRWFRYSEADIVRLPARDLIALEKQIGITIVSVMNSMRANLTMGDLAAAWIAVRAADAELAGPFGEFNPLILMTEWREWVQDEGKAQDSPPPSENPIPEPTVTLQTLPVTE